MLDADGDRRICTVLFTDVSGFTSMSEDLDPEQVAGIMNGFFDVLTRCIYRFGGTVDKYIGDAIMALFGAPIAHEDDAERAVSAAWDMQAEARTFAADLEARTGIVLRIRIGINTGLVVAGEVGGHQKRDYTVLGDAVNLASRLESSCRPGEIMVSRETQRLARRTFFFTPLDPIKVKGKSEPVEVFEVAGRRSQPPEGDERPPFAGRAQELAMLSEAFSRVRPGEAGIALLVGEAGIGKSRLAGEFEKFALRSGGAVLKARCFSYQQAIPYSLVAHLLTEGMGAREPGALTRLCAEAGLADPTQAARALGHVLGDALTDPELASLTAEQLHAYVNRALIALLRQRAQLAPLVLSLVDLHWLDTASARWLSSAIAEFAARPATVFFLLQARPEGEALLDLPRTALRIRLGPLAESEGLAIVESLLEAEVTGNAGRLVREALDRAEGNPFYLCEILRTLTEQGLLILEGDRWDVRQSAATALPATIQGTIAARVDTLPQPARQALQVASVVGRRCPKPLLATLLGDPQLEAQLGELVAAELVHVTPDDQVVFNQAMIGEVVYEGLLVKTRKGLHRQVGQILEAQAAVPDALVATLALHFERAGEDERAAPYLRVSARQAKERFANSEARRAAASALAALDRLAAEAEPGSRSPSEAMRAELLLLLGDAEAALGRYDPALDAYGRALEAAGPDQVAAVHRALGEVRDQQGDYAVAVEAYQHALDRAQDSHERGTALGLLAHVAYRQADYATAVARCEAAIAQLDPDRHPKEVAKAESVLGLCCWRTGQLAEADAHHRRALALREQIRDIYGIGASLTNLAQLGSELGRWRQALELARQALDLYERIGDPQRICSGAMVVGGLEMDLGEYEAARSHLERSLEQARRIGHPLSTALSLANLGDLTTRQGRPEGALDDLSEAIAILERLGGKGHLAQAQVLLGTASLRLGRDAEAKDALDRALELAEAAGEKATVGAALHRLAIIHLGAGRIDEALQFAGKGIALLQEAHYQQELGHGFMHLAEVVAAQGNLALRDQALRKAVAIFEQIGAEPEARRARDLLEPVKESTP